MISASFTGVDKGIELLFFRVIDGVILVIEFPNFSSKLDAIHLRHIDICQNKLVLLVAAELVQLFLAVLYFLESLGT